MYVILVLVATRTTYTLLTGLGVALRLCTVTHTGLSGKATTKRNGAHRTQSVKLYTPVAIPCVHVCTLLFIKLKIISRINRDLPVIRVYVENVNL